MYDLECFKCNSFETVIKIDFYFNRSKVLNKFFIDIYYFNFLLKS